MFISVRSQKTTVSIAYPNTNLANTFVRTLIDVRTIAAGGDREACFTLAFVRPWRVATSTAATNSRVVATFVYIATRVTCLC